MPGYEYCPSLVEAVQHNDIRGVNQLLRMRASPNVRDQVTKRTVLMIAAEKGHIEVVRKLIEHRAFIDLTDREENMAIHWAAYGGSLQCLQFLIDKGSLLDVLNANKYTPLMLAILKGHRHITAFLLERDPFLIRGLNEHEESEFLLAITRNDLETARLIYQTDVPGIDKVKELQVALQQAALKKDTAILTFLISMGANVNNSTEEEDPVIFSAVFAKDAELVKFFIQNGANVNSKDRNGKTPLVLAITLGLEDIVDVLVSHGAEVSADALNLAHREGPSNILNALKRPRE
nr:ankyrin repeat domain protein 17 [Hymenolepis microstoma]